MKRKHIISLCALVYFASYFSRKNFAILMSDLLKNNIIDKSTGGLICLALFICYGIGQVFSGYLGDKLKPKHMISIGLITTAICNLLMISTSIPILLIIIWGINGLAQSMLWPPIVKILSTNLDNENYVKANLIVTSAAHISTILLYLYIPICILCFSWQFVFISSSILALITCTIFLICINNIINKKDTKKELMVEKNTSAPLKTIFDKVPLIVIFLIIVAMGCLRDGIETWLPTLYQEAFNRESSESILISIILPIFSILSITLTTSLHKKSKLINNEILGCSICFIITTVFSIVILLIINSNNTIARYASLTLSALVCATMHGCNFLLISCLPGRFKQLGRSATVSGFCNAFTYVGAAISTYGFAILSENYGWTFIITSWIIISIMGLILSITSKNKYTDFIVKN